MKKMACLVIHGFGGSSFEMEGIAHALESIQTNGEIGVDTTKQAIEVHNLCLSGHDVSKNDFPTKSFANWKSDVEKAYDALALRYENIMVIGFSMGGTLALHLGIVRKPCAIVTIAAPVFMYSIFPPIYTDWRMPFVGLIKHIRPTWPKICRSDAAIEIAPYKGYDGDYLLSQVHSLIRGACAVKWRLAKVTAPILIFHAKRDGVVPVENAPYIAKKVSSPDVRMRIISLEEERAGFHILVTHKECHALIESEIQAYAKEMLGFGK